MIPALIRTTLIALVFGLSSLAMAAPQLSLNILVEKDIIEINEQGQEVTRRVETADAIPGDTLFYTIRYTNSGDEPARDVKIDNPVPQGATYLNDAWGDNATITFSVDAGKSYTTADELSVNDKTATGQTTQRPAQAADYTHIRWVVNEILPGSTGQVGFSAKVQ